MGARRCALNVVSLIILDPHVHFLFVLSYAEFTTMAGRRLRDAVKTALISGASQEFKNAHVVIAGLTNTYSQYVTTFEEYQMQRYEVSIPN